MSELSVNISDGPNAVSKVVVVVGEMDESSLDTIKSQMDPLLADVNIKNIIFDLRQLEFINSKGIGYLVSVHTHLSKDQRELILAGANEAVMDVISLVGLTTIIKYFNTYEEALAGLSA
ncbi:STAS domain-containing protein [candidate division KSB1 bacterium]